MQGKRSVEAREDTFLTSLFNLLPSFKSYLPVLTVLALLILLGYPLALVFGLPLAYRDMQDIRKWEKETVTERQPLQGEVNGENRVFVFPVDNLVENDGDRTLFAGDAPLTYDARTSRRTSRRGNPYLYV